MAKKRQKVGAWKRSHSNKTKKRLATKKTMLASKAAKKNRRKRK